MTHFLQLFFIVVVFVIVFVSFLLTNHLLITSASDYYDCYRSQCPNGEMIRYPFYSENSNDEYYCGYLGLSAKCSGGGRGKPILTLSNHSYYYQHIDFNYIRLRDIDTSEQKCPQPRYNFTLEGVVASSLVMYEDVKNISLFYNCTALPKDVESILPCLDQTKNNAIGRSFAMPDSSIPMEFNWYANCQKKVVLPVYESSDGMNYTEAIKLGFDLKLKRSESCQKCEDSGGQCLNKKNSNAFRCVCNLGMLYNEICPHSSHGVPRKLIIGLSAGAVGSLFTLLLISTRRCSKDSATNEEVFLQSYESQVLQRYTYLDIKKMTNFFKDRLGQGGFGFVFKGKLPNGRMVAVKLLNESKGDGEEFINEVATISRTNHINIVTLIGFCIERTKRALVYEFMVNGSLEKFIYKEKSSTTSYAPT